MLIFILNPISGCGHGQAFLQQLEQLLQQEQVAYEIRLTQAPGHATQLAREAAAEKDCEGVVAVGGDGTLHEVASGLLGTGVPMGIIPTGTGNDFIRSLGYPKDPVEALHLLLKRQVKPVDLVSINDGCFLNVGGCGFDVMVLQQAERYHGRLKGMMPYFLGLLRAIAIYRPVQVQLQVDGKIRDEKALICAIANGRVFGGGIPICPEASVDDGMLDLVLVHDVPRWRLPFYLPGLMMGRVLKFGITEHIRCRTVALRGKGLDVQSDGEIRKMDEAVMAVCPGQLLVYR